KNWQIPGMHLASPEKETRTYPAAMGVWQPTDDRAFGPEQPILKLHGSSNWRTVDSKEMLILGGGKKEAIARYPVLSWYFQEFSRRLSEPNTRLMIIGYSFRDAHINEVLHSSI